MSSDNNVECTESITSIKIYKKRVIESLENHQSKRLSSKLFSYKKDATSTSCSTEDEAKDENKILRKDISNKNANLLSEKKNNKQIKSKYFKKKLNVINSASNNSDPNNLDFINSIPTNSLLVNNTVEDVASENLASNNWFKQFQNIKIMRESKNAQVDIMGCDKIYAVNAEPKDKRFQILMSLMMSSQTKDEVTSAAMLRLLEKNLNSAEKMMSVTDYDLQMLIYPVSFYKTKAKNMKKTSGILAKEYDGDIPDNVQELCKLPGIGPKMAYLAVQCAWNKLEGIGVDTHVHRISNRLGWVKSKNPEDTRLQLEKLLPRDVWVEVNHLLVGFGQQICKPMRPSCSNCLNKLICPSSSSVSKLDKVKENPVLRDDSIVDF